MDKRLEILTGGPSDGQKVEVKESTTWFVVPARTSEKKISDVTGLITNMYEQAIYRRINGRFVYQGSKDG